MAKRVSEIISEKARRAAGKATHHAKRGATLLRNELFIEGSAGDKHDLPRSPRTSRPPISRRARKSLIIASGVAIGVLLVVGIVSLLYAVERNKALGQDPLSPLKCSGLRFEANRKACEGTLYAFYEGKQGLERKPICDRTERDYREGFGRASSLCPAYDDAQTEALYEEGLASRGISVWEPDKDIITSGTLHARTTGPASSVTLACGNRIVPVDAQTDDNGDGIITLTIMGQEGGPAGDQADGECTLIATVPAGSISSLPFSLAWAPGAGGNTSG